MNYSDEEFYDIINSDHEEYETVESPSVYDTDRWSISLECIVKKLSDETFWSITWAKGATEYQKVEPDFCMTEVEPVEVTKIQYKVKK